MIAARLVLKEATAMELYVLNYGVTKYFGELALSAAMQRQLRVLNGTTSLRAVPSSGARNGVTGFSADAVENVRQREARVEAARNRTTPPEPPRMAEYAMQVRLEQAPNPASRVMLSQEKDALGMPRTRLDWQLSAFEKRSIRQMHEVFATEVGKLGIGRVQLSDWLLTDEPLWPSNLGAGWHHMGTTRMHDDPKQGVVDGHCKVHGLGNLHIAGSAVFPTAGAANPTLTLIAMTLRLSDRLKNLLG